MPGSQVVDPPGEGPSLMHETVFRRQLLQLASLGLLAVLTSAVHSEISQRPVPTAPSHDTVLKLPARRHLRRLAIPTARAIDNRPDAKRSRRTVAMRSDTRVAEPPSVVNRHASAQTVDADASPSYRLSTANSDDDLFLEGSQRDVQTEVDISGLLRAIDSNEPARGASPTATSTHSPHDVGDDAAADTSPQDHDPHFELFSRCKYPSAQQCGECHKRIYREWSVSGHAYASISPMFQKFEQKINDLTVGTIGYFCLRCHAPVATAMGIPRDANLLGSNVIPAAREGVTCIACHRVVERYGRVNGERRIEPGPIHAPVVGAGDGSHFYDVLQKKNDYQVKTSIDDKGPGQDIHARVIQFSQVSSSHFCVSCHQVAVYPGIALEVVWAQYRSSPACKTGIRCQDCHMGAVPGRPEGFETAPSAVVGNKPVHPERRHSNHMFVGPGYSIAHPGIFPFNKKAKRWTYEDWLKFDWRAGWGTDAFENQLTDERADRFPKPWDNIDERYDAREIIDENQELLNLKTSQRFVLMEGNSKVEGPFFACRPTTDKPLKFYYRVQNLNSGHNLPSGSLGAQPQLWLNVVLTGPDGQWLWESGYVDANGDLADMHSLEVAANRACRDKQLVNFQTKFLITGVKGTDREMYLPINVDLDQLPFIRPSGFPITTMNHPPFIRMEAHSIPPLGRHKASYVVPKRIMRRPGRYRLSVRMRSRAEPIYFMRFCQATPEMERSMNEEMLDFHQHAFEFIVK